jgi:hypothetical protein
VFFAKNRANRAAAVPLACVVGVILGLMILAA